MHIFSQKHSKNLAEDMVRENNPKQLSIQEFKTPFYRGLDKNNRWVSLAQVLPWEEMTKIYTQSLHKTFGRPAAPTRIVIGALIIKHKLRMSDEETIATIQENPYLQYFIGNEEFSHKPAFDPSLFVTIRKRLGDEALADMNAKFISMVKTAEKEQWSQSKKKKRKSSKASNSFAESPEEGSEKSSEEPTHKGVLLLDATVAPADIKYPTDLDLLNSSREHSERLIDMLYEPEAGKVKPRTYRRKARKDYLSLAKKRKKSVKELRKGLRKQLNYLKRNLHTTSNLLDSYKDRKIPFAYKDFKTLWVITEVYRQQKEMYDQHRHKIADRIVNISQPHVRPIVRGKAGKDVEFGAKISASVIDGYTFLDRVSWDAYNESSDLPLQVERYKERFGYYPAVVVTDQIYGTRGNRKYLKERLIRFSGKSLGRPPKEAALDDAFIKVRQKQRKYESRLRNHIEGKFGEGKRSYDLGLVKTKTARTSEAWIAAVFFVMNLARWLRDYFLSLFSELFSTAFRVSFAFKERLSVLTWA